MKILKYKKQTNNRYKIFFDNNLEIVLYEDVILKYGLLYNKEINDKDIEKIKDDNLEWDVYYTGLNYIKHYTKSIYEVRNKLLSKEYPIELVDNTVDKLIQQGYLNDESYAKSYIYHMMMTSSWGPLKIKKELLDKKVDIKIIDKELNVFNREEEEIRIHKIIRRELKSNRSRGMDALKQKIYNNLVNLGYNVSIINELLNEYSYDIDEDIRSREYNKLYRRLSRKYSGEELNNKINEKLRLKGLYIE